MTKTNYISASVALLAALFAASVLALGLANVASSQEGDKQTPAGGGGEDGSISTAAVEPQTHEVLEKEIDSNGKLGSIWVNDQLGCQVDHSGNGEGGEFYGGELSSIVDVTTYDFVSCATWLAVGSETFGIYYEELTPVSQSLGGKGTKRKPFKITTVSDVGTTGLRVTEVDSYRVLQDYYRTNVTIQNRTNSRISAIVYRGGDCYLNLSDELTKGKVVDGNQPACESTDIAKPEELRLIPISSGSSYHAGIQGGVWDKLDVQEPYENTIVNNTGDTAIDSGVGLSWNVSVGGGNKVTRSNYTKVTIP